ncbi:MAG: hypothetical protein ACKKL4_00135 [Patescibacteria group bacterium]
MISIQHILFKKRYFDRRVYAFIVAFSAIIVFDIYAVANVMYYRYGWLDNPVHLIAGWMLGLALYYLVYANVYTAKYFNQKLERAQVFSVVVFWVLVVALTWEVVEFLYGRTFLSPNFALDLFLDISMTSLGALMAYLMIRYYKKL